MKIDMFWIFALAFAFCVFFDTKFTVKKYIVDISYMYDSLGEKGYSQMEIVSTGGKPSASEAQKFVREMLKEETGKTPNGVVIFMMRDVRAERYFRPFWRKNYDKEETNGSSTNRIQPEI